MQGSARHLLTGPITPLAPTPLHPRHLPSNWCRVLPPPLSFNVFFMSASISIHLIIHCLFLIQPLSVSLSLSLSLYTHRSMRDCFALEPRGSNPSRTVQSAWQARLVLPGGFSSTTAPAHRLLEAGGWMLQVGVWRDGGRGVKRVSRAVERSWLEFEVSLLWPSVCAVRDYQLGPRTAA